MKEPRHARSMRDRKSHLSPDAERLVAAALGLSNSGSRTEDRFWERALTERIVEFARQHGPTTVGVITRHACLHTAVEASPVTLKPRLSR